MTQELFTGEEKCKNVLKDVLRERLFQESKWGQQNHPQSFYYLILAEEVGEVAKCILKGGVQKNPAHLRCELTQVAAVAVAMIESLDRNKQ